MKVVISAGGRFHAIKLAQQLEQRDSLLKLFSFSYTTKDRASLNQSHVKVMHICKVLDDAFSRLRMSRVINPSLFNQIKDNAFDYCVNKQISKLSQIDLFTGWAHYSLKSMQTAREKGAVVIIESGSSHIQEQQYLLEKEYKKWGITFSPILPKVIEKMVQEYEAADYIMTLSTTSRNSFINRGFNPTKILQVPCGSDVTYFMQPPKIEAPSLNKFRVIFVGLINIRKGIPYLLEAWHKANLPEDKAELILVGSLQKDMAQLLPKFFLQKNIILFGPTTQATLKQLYYQSSVFVLPSIEDGFGMVMSEAMACGLPIICSTNTGAPDVIDHGIHGFLVPPQNSLALAEKITWCYEHKDACKYMGNNGQARIKDFTWDAYGEKVYTIYSNLLNKKNGVT